jgi:glycosyltransferase involved in cell wall biosynthesis
MADARAGITASIGETEIVIEGGGRFSIRLPEASVVANAFLVIDIYALDNPVHPEGHIGWWRYEIAESPQHLVGFLSRDPDGRIAPEVDGMAPADEWQNSAVPDVRRMELLVVLRSSITNAILSKDRVPVLLTAEDLRGFRARTDRELQNPRYRPSVHKLVAGQKVHIVSKSMFERDAVGNLCFELYKMLSQVGLQPTLFADNFDLAMNGVINRRVLLSDFVEAEDSVVYFFSIFDETLEDVIGLACGCRIAYYHGITPPQLLQLFDPEVAAQSAKGVRQLPLLGRFDRLAANSLTSADELSAVFSAAGVSGWPEIAVIPPKILSEAELQAPRTGRVSKVAERPNLLFVGRVKSHKRVEDLLALIAAVRHLNPEARCTIVGAADTAAYSDYLDWLQKQQLGLPEAAVDWRGAVSDEGLARAYTEATVYVSMSEHEGFGLPILEAMMHDIPVFCFAVPAVRELLGASGAIFTEKSFPKLASRLHDLLSSPAEISNQLNLQRDRVIQLVERMDGSGFLRLLESGGFPDAPGSSRMEVHRVPSQSG